MVQIPRGLIRPYLSRLALFFRLLDGAWIAGGLWLIVAYDYKAPWGEYYNVAVLAVILFYLFAEHQDLYRSWRGGSIREEGARLWWAWLWVILGLLFLAFVTKTSASYSRRVILPWFIVTPLLLIAWRVGVRQALHVLRVQGRNMRTAAIAGAGDLGVGLGQVLLGSPWMGIQLSGFYDEKGPVGVRPLPGSNVEVRGRLDDLVELAREGQVDMVYITLPMREEARMRRLAAALADTTASVYMVPDVYIFDLLHARLTNLGGFPVIGIRETPFDGVGGWIKRLEDIVLGGLVLLLAVIPMAIFAVGVKLSSPGPVIFRQRRYGLNGEIVKVLKFRTMTACEDGDRVPQARKNDPRVTSFGAFLRRTSLDELPQLINVLLGHMSLVGPRPHPVALNEEYRKRIYGYMLRHKVKPGITGWAQVNGWRGETDSLDKMEKRVVYDLEYIRHWSMWLDLKIIVKTILVGFRDRNAY